MFFHAPYKVPGLNFPQKPDADGLKVTETLDYETGTMTFIHGEKEEEDTS